MNKKPDILGSKNNWDMDSKIVFQNNPIEFLTILYPTSLANLVVEVRIRHSHQILLDRGYNVRFWLDYNKINKNDTRRVNYYSPALFV